MQDILLAILKESLFGSLGIIKNLILIIVPLMIFIQIMIDYHWLERLSTKLKFITDFIGVSKDALVPMLIGVCAGISYGAGAILDAKERYGLCKEDAFLVMCVLVPFHAIFEIGLIYWVIGVNPLLILAARIAVALSGVLLSKKFIVDRRKQQSPA